VQWPHEITALGERRIEAVGLGESGLRDRDERVEFGAGAVDGLDAFQIGETTSRAVNAPDR
jgi:hypothetical protein